MLKNVKDNCRNIDNPGHQYCSGDGHICDKTYLQHNNMLAGLDCPRCYEQCRKYRKWIDIKFEEFEKQKDKYKGEREKVVTSSTNGGGDNNCCEQIKNHSSAAEFLKDLKHCKPHEDNSDENNEDKKNNEINFENPLETFRHSKYCETCPLQGVTCGGKSGKDPCTEVNGNGETWETVFNGNDENTTKIDVQMIDRRGPFIKEYLENSKKSEKSNDLFKTSRLFKAIREQKWTCKFKDKNMDVCKLDQFKDNIDLNQYTTFKVLLIYWLEDFLYGYYLLKKKKIIEQCKENGGETSNENSKNDCACVKVWLEKKKKEWGDIKNHFKNRKSDDDKTYTIEYTVKTFLEELIPRMDLVNDKGKHESLDAFLKSYECKCADNSQNSTQNDVVLCLLENLKKEIEQCNSVENSVEISGKNTAQCKESAHVEDDEEDLLLEDENPVTQPNICPEPPKEEAKEEEKCEPAAPAPAPSAETDKEKPVPEPPSPPEPAPAAPPPLAPSDESILQTTIPFGIALALGSIAFFFMK
ncbi:hypothetical protein PFTANZ_06044, partial [Plasmodium falciparum Tanzania (2000708)]